MRHRIKHEAFFIGEEELSLTGTSKDFWHRKPGKKSTECVDKVQV